MIPMDLNLLRIFDILMEQRSVTRAGQRLGLTQSAVSHALRRLREHFGDPLFVRGPGGLQPTPRAEAMAGGVRSALLQLEDVLSDRSFDHRTSTRVFEISAGAYFSTVLLPGIIAHAREESPNIAFKMLMPGADMPLALDSGQVDIALGSFGRVADRLRKEYLYTEELVWIAAARSLPEGEVDIDALADRPRLAVSTGGRQADASGIITMTGVEQRTAMPPPTGRAPYATVHDALSATALVAASDLMALVPNQIASREAERWQLRLVRPRDSEPIELSMLWHSRFERDPAHMWLRALVRRACASLA